MATETTQRLKEFTDEDFSTLIEAPCLTAPISVGREPQRVVPKELDTDASVPEHKDGVLVRIGRSILGFHDRLSGPAMSNRERLSVYQESTQLARRIGPFV